MKTFFIKFFNKSREVLFIRIIHQALTIMIPFTMVMVMMTAFLNLPIPAYQELLLSPDFFWFYSILNIINKGLTTLFSPTFAMVIALSYTTSQGISVTKAPFYVIVALAAYGTSLNMASSQFSAIYLSTQGCFMAIFVSFISCHIFYHMEKHPLFHRRKDPVGLEILCTDAIRFIIPAGIICFFWASINQVIYLLFDTINLQHLLVKLFEMIFDNLGNGFFSAILYTVLVHLLWLCGFHGSWMLETVAENKFTEILPNVIFNRRLFDVFVVMGGCGTSICVLLAILLFVRKKRLKKMAHAAVFPAIFNINEILNFGIPMVLNPILGVPFLLTPIMALIVSYGAVAIGFMPPVVQDVGWTTPILFSGYQATGSIRGIIVQLIIIAIGIAFYVPFLKYNEQVHESFLKKRLDDMITTMRKMEDSHIPVDFLEKNDDTGLLAQMLLRDLKLAIKNRDLFFLYQPQMNHENKCIGGEALLRWNHPVFGFIYPPLIIYIAKAGGILPQLEALLFDTACSTIKKVSEEIGEDFKISVNITSQSLNWDGFEECVESSLAKYQVSAKNLWMEITEQDMLSNSQLTVEKIQRLKAKGHFFMIDDFGMGHTSLIYLQSNYFDVVKLDGSLVKSILTSTTNQKIVSSVVDLSKKLDIHVVAEFVETEDEKNTLCDLGCFWYQGYLYSPAIPLDKFLSYLKAHR